MSDSCNFPKYSLIIKLHISVTCFFSLSVEVSGITVSFSISDIACEGQRTEHMHLP